jgi:hypothetical protein
MIQSRNLPRAHGADCIRTDNSVTRIPSSSEDYSGMSEKTEESHSLLSLFLGESTLRKGRGHVVGVQVVVGKVSRTNLCPSHARS